MPSFNPGGSLGDNFLYGVAAISSGNAWAIGYFKDNGFHETTVSHWDGRFWRHIASPNATHNDDLRGVAATSSRNAWAVGYSNATGGSTGPDQTLALHWNGARWRHVPSPNPGCCGGDLLNGVAATTFHDAWAVGYYFNGTQDQTLVLHWNGRWRHVPSPKPGSASHDNLLSGAAGTSSSNIWAVSYYLTRYAACRAW